MSLSEAAMAAVAVSIATSAFSLGLTVVYLRAMAKASHALRKFVLFFTEIVLAFVLPICVFSLVFRTPIGRMIGSWGRIGCAIVWLVPMLVCAALNRIRQDALEAQARR